MWAEAVARTKRRQKSEAVERCHCKRRRVRKKRTERERLSGGPAAGDGTGEERGALGEGSADSPRPTPSAPPGETKGEERAPRSST